MLSHLPHAEVPAQGFKAVCKRRAAAPARLSRAGTARRRAAACSCAWAAKRRRLPRCRVNLLKPATWLGNEAEARMRICTRTTAAAYGGVGVGAGYVRRRAPGASGADAARTGAGGRIERPMVVMTFDRHPLSLIAPAMAPPMLTTPEERLAADRRRRARIS